MTAVARDDYNYPVFLPEADDDFAGFAEHLKVGQPAPDFAMTTLDGHRVSLSESWRGGDVVLEFGSLT